MSKTFYFILFLCSSLWASSQSYTIEGRVINLNTQSPLIGCSVYNVTRQTGTITNEDGNYRLTVQKGDLVQYSFIGMLPIERTIIESETINVEMKYLVRKIRDVVINGGSLAKNSVLYNKNFERRVKNKFIEPKRKTAQEKMMEAAPSITADGGFNFSPITFLYYAFSKKEQRRLQAVIDIQQMDNSNQKYSLEFISAITGEENIDELKDIKAHCYFPHDLVLRSSFYELGIILKECYVGYLVSKSEKEKLLEQINQPSKN